MRRRLSFADVLAVVEKVPDLSGIVLVGGQALNFWAETLGIELRPKKVVRFDTMYTAAHAAEHGVGVALVSSRLGHERFMQGSLVKLFDAELETGESYFLILRKEDASRPDIQALTRWILDEFSAAA